MREGGIGLDRVGVVLVRPKLSENIGTAARAAGNMGLGRLILVDPYRYEIETALSAATRAGQRLVEEARVVAALAEALADFHYVVGTTARPGSHRGPFLTPRTLAQNLAGLGPDDRIALVFGPERTGLTTAELRRCQAVVTIPTAAPAARSLNLAQAVLILGYELLLTEAGPPSAPRIQRASIAEVEAVYEHMQRAFTAVGFLPEENTEHWLMSFKRLFNRTGLTHSECNLWRGLCRQIEHVVKHGPWPTKKTGEPKAEAG
jgi:tRNA/rRNA methyltransferase